MRKILMINVLCLVSLTTLLGQTVENRIAPPVNYIRETCDEHSFTSYLRQLPLLPKGSKVVLYNGHKKDMEKLSLTLPTAFPQNTRNGQKETGLK